MIVDLSEKVAAVTGAGCGLGLAIAGELARAGAAVAVIELDGDAGRHAAAELKREGARARAYEADISHRTEVDATLASVKDDFGRLDVLVNNAGISRIGPHTEDVSDVDWLDTIAVMQTGVFYCMRAAGRIMLEQGAGSIVNISSIRGFSPNPGRLAYCAAKAAVIMMTRVAAGEWAGRGVRVNAIAPGPVRTAMWEEDVRKGLIDEEEYCDVIPAHRLGEPSEVGKVAVYLASDMAAYITGDVLTIDGGLTSIPAG